MARTVLENECDRSVSSAIKSRGAGLLSGTGKSQIMAGSLEGKVAVISGGATGIGLTTSKKFGAEGAHVFTFLVHARLSFAPPDELGAIAQCGTLPRLASAVLGLLLFPIGYLLEAFAKRHEQGKLTNDLPSH